MEDLIKWLNENPNAYTDAKTEEYVIPVRLVIERLKDDTSDYGKSFDEMVNRDTLSPMLDDLNIR